MTASAADATKTLPNSYVNRSGSAEDTLDLFFDASPDLLCIADFEGNFVRLNRAWTLILGWSEEELRSTPFLEFVHPEDRDKTVAEYAGMLGAGRGSVHFTNRYRTRTGQYRWLEWNSTVDGVRGQVIANARDVTLQVEQREELERQRVELARLARHDHLTGLANRIVLFDRLSLHYSQRSPEPLAVLYIDLDKFKPINDQYGHEFGDEFLRAVAARLLSATREGDTVCRVGGDEFVIVGVVANRNDAVACAERVQAVLQESMAVGLLVIHPSASIGVAFGADFPTPASVVSGADKAMLRAKRSPSTAVRLAEPCNEAGRDAL